jgi:CYTH domain-containing protein
MQKKTNCPTTGYLIEIERKWLVKNGLSLKEILLNRNDIIHQDIVQIYLIKEKNYELRIREIFDHKTQTVTFTKTEKKGHGLVRPENEVKINKDEFEFLKISAIAIIKKTRLKFHHIDVDFYKDDLVTMEVEFTSEKEANEYDINTLPLYVDFIEREITGNKDYSNFVMAKKTACFPRVQKDS